MAGQRREADSLGEVSLPADVLYGVHSARAAANFPITGTKLSDYPELIQSLGMVKKAAALANMELGALEGRVGAAIGRACDRVIAGEADGDFIVDMLQGGAGTSTNMNANEVIANLALRELQRQPGHYDLIHPNDHVNLSQSTNDAYPSAVRLTMVRACPALAQELLLLKNAFIAKAEAFHDIIKVGRTQLMDAVPMRLGDEFRAFGVTVGEDIDRLLEVGNLLREINLGGTAIGTGINTPVGYVASVIRHLSAVSGEKVIAAGNLIEATSDMGAFVVFSGVLKRIAVKLSKICNDLRLLNSGPRAGFGEIKLPPVQAGSSIMPGKVNPVMPEVINQIAFQVIGNDLTVTLAAEGGELQLNAFEPVIVFNILQSMRMLTRGMKVLRERCVDGIEADRARCAFLLEHSLVAVTAINPYVGYAKASAVAKEALATGMSVRAVVLKHELMTDAQLDEAFSVENLLGQRL